MLLLLLYITRVVIYIKGALKIFLNTQKNEKAQYNAQFTLYRK